MGYMYTYRRYREPSIGQVIGTLIFILVIIGIFADFESGLYRSYDESTEEVVKETCTEENCYFDDECK